MSTLTLLWLQEKHAASIAALEAELATSKQDTLAAKADAEICVKEAIMAADKKVIRLTERTAKVSSLGCSRLQTVLSHERFEPSF